MDIAAPAGSRTGPIDLAVAAAGLAEVWSPRVAGRVNDVLVKVARLDGDFVWHNHPDTDEAFLCLDGRLVIDLRDGIDPEGGIDLRDGIDLEGGGPTRARSIELAPGEFYVVPRGVYHCPHAPGGATVALFEAAGVVNTGQAGGGLTAPVDRPLD